MGKWLLIVCVLYCSCMQRQMAGRFPAQNGSDSLTGTKFFELAKSYSWRQRDSLALVWFKQGAIPKFWKKFSVIKVRATDSVGKWQRLKYWVSPDYFVLGTNQDWVRVPITPMAAMYMMEQTNCLLPTRKMVDQIYTAARVKLATVPMYAFRDSGITMYQHHLIIEGQRHQRRGLIGGIKKDVVSSYKLEYGVKKDRVAIYGWHQPNGKPIQPLYLGHINWYVDYSHGIRFVSNKARLNGKQISMQEVMSNPALQTMVCNEDTCGYFKYPDSVSKGF